MNLLITGALGHIGSRLIHGLKPGDFDKVVLVDNMSTQRYASLFDLPAGVSFKFIQDDICTADLNEYFKGIDIVLHLAAITDAAGSFEIQEQVERVNYQGTERVARACEASGSKLIFLSTTSVYGVQDGEVNEDCPVDQLQPQSPYADTKLKSEQFLRHLGRNETLRYVICRFGTIFGTSIGMRFHTAVNKFCWQAVTGQPITVWRTALEQKRPYLDLDDAVEAVKLIINRDLFDGGLYNVVTVNSTVGDIVDAISEHLPNTSIEYVDSPIMNQLSYNVNSDRFKDLGFEFTGSLRQGIDNTISLFDSLRTQKG